MPISTLILDPEFEITKSYSIPTAENKLGDGYRQITSKSFSEEIKWQVKATGLTTAKINQLNADLKSFQGVQGFYWQPNEGEPLEIYQCEKWDTTVLAPNLWAFSAEFVRDSSGECIAFRAFIDTAELDSWILGLRNYIATYYRDTLPLIFNSAGLAVNSFHDVLGRGGYFPGSAGTSEAQAIAIKGAMWAYEATGDVTWLTWATNFANAMLNFYYSNPTPPDNPNDLWIPHWLINIKYPFPTKGKVATKDINSGYFDQTVTFTNGEAFIPTGGTTNGERLSNIYKVYSDNGLLLWKNVYAPLISGTEYAVDYWVSNFLMNGQNFRIYPDTESSGGSAPTPTSEPAGKIVLKTNFSGQGKLVYSAYTTTIVNVNQRFDAYPMWRTLAAGEFNCAFDTLPWLYQGFKKLHTHTGDIKWFRAAEACKQNTFNTSVIANLSHYYKPLDTDDPFSYPGSQAVQVNNPNGYTASRETVANKKDWLKLVVNAAPAGNFPSMEVQNFAVQTGFTSATGITANYAHSQRCIMSVVLSGSSNAFDFSDLYQAEMIATGSGTPDSKNFVDTDFIKWGNTNTIWHPTVVETPIFVYSGSGGSTENDYKQVTIESNKPVIWETRINKGSSGFAGMGYNRSSNRLVRPPKIRWNIIGDPVILRITDGDGYKWDKELNDTNGWKTVQYQWGEFQWSDENSVERNGRSADVQNDIQQIEVVATGDTRIQTWWMLSKDEPEILPVPIVCYKASIVERVKTAHTVWVGLFKPTGNTFDALEYPNGGVFPFTINIKGFPSTPSIDGWRGLPYSGYQEPGIWRLWGDEVRCEESTRFLRDAQNAYTAQSQDSIVGPFAPAFAWRYWDTLTIAGNNLSRFVFDNLPDPNYHWCGYQTRPLVAVAESWKLNPADTVAKQIVMRFLGWLDSFFTKYNTNSPPTNYFKIVEPQILYLEPHTASHILRAALYANLSGGSPAITFRIIKRMLDFLRSQRVTSGPMAGDFSAGQPSFTVGGTTFSESFPFWSMDILHAICELKINAANVRLPSCDTPISNNL